MIDNSNNSWIEAVKQRNKTQKLLYQALKLDTKARTLLLEDITDPSIRAQVETLLLDEEERSQFMETARKDLAPGDQINRIRIDKLLGQGGMGSVYLGFDEKLERQVAIKSIRPEHLQNPATQKRFEREAQILSKINHPSICQLYDYMETNEGDFLVLEFIKGKPLYQVPLTATQKLEVLKDLAAALAVAHEHGIVHRDLKPDNIMITDQGQLKVLDFGIAQSLSQPQPQQRHDEPVEAGDGLTQHGSLVGTIRYMSPEQAQGKVIGTASDIYALGIIGQEVFSHQAAYPVMETEQLLQDVRHGRHKPITGLPTDVTQLLNDLMQVEPENRPAASETVARVEDIIQTPKKKRQRRVKGLIGVVALLLLSVLVWQWLQYNRQSDQNQRIKAYESQIEDLVEQSEQIYVLPIHPIEEEITSLLEQAQQLFGTIHNDASLSKTARKRLQGIIMLEAEYFNQAIPLLEAGQAEPALLAEAWTALYIEKASDFSDQHGLAATMQSESLRTEYLEPALKYIQLDRAEGKEVKPIYQAFVSSQTDSLEAGLKAVNAILEGQHWNKKAVKLKALILSALAEQAREQGQWEQARAWALQTAATYERSTQMARSYPFDYTSLCLQHHLLLADGVVRTGLDVPTHAKAAIQACENTLTIQPSNDYAMNLLSATHIIEAFWRVHLNQDVTEQLATASRWNEKAKTTQATDQNKRNEALIQLVHAKQLMGQGKDSMEPISQAVKALEQLLTNNPQQPFVVGDVLMALAHLATEQIRKGIPHQETLAKAKNWFDQGMKTPALQAEAQRNLIINQASIEWVDLLFRFIQGEDIRDPSESLLQLLTPKDIPMENEPNQMNMIANVHLFLVHQTHRQQLDPKVHLNLAQEQAQLALKIDPNNDRTLMTWALIQAWQAHVNGGDFKAAENTLQQAAAINPNNPYLHRAWAEVAWLRWRNASDPTAKDKAKAQAQSHIEQALANDGLNPWFVFTAELIQKQ